MNRRLSWLVLSGTILISAQTIGIATSNPLRQAACTEQSCELCPGGPCGSSCPLPCADDDSSCSTISCPLPGVVTGANQSTLVSLTVE